LRKAFESAILFASQAWVMEDDKWLENGDRQPVVLRCVRMERRQGH
jgi:hypothetical protein